MFCVRESSMLREAPLVLCALLLGCGGGGGGGGGGGMQPGPGNSPPGFTSAASASVAENSSGTIYTATATDPDGQALTFSLSGGADRADFAITAGGALSFAQTPDFEVPADADGNNVYLVQIAVSDGITSTTLDLSVTVTNAGPDGFRVTRVGTGFVEPLFLRPVPDGSGRVFVVEKGGRVRILNPATGATTLFMDISAQIGTAGEGGLLGFAPAPNFATSNVATIYAYVTSPAGNIEVRRYLTFPNAPPSPTPRPVDPSTQDVILAIPHPTFINHYGGWMEFGADNFLYISVGDGGGGGGPPGNSNSQNLGNLLGKILRIDPGSDAFPGDAARDYAIPPANPFAASGGSPEIWAYGLRNPFRAGFDPLTGNLWIGDVGESAREEIDLLRPGDGGANFGWRIVEGTVAKDGVALPGFTPPVAEYLHGTGPREGNSITGGYVYRGAVESLRGQYFFGDFVTGNIWSIPVAQVALGTTLASGSFILRRQDFTPNQGAINNISSFGLDQAGNLYIVDFDGEIFRIEAI